MFNPIPILGLIPSLLSYWQKKQEMKLRWFELLWSVFKDTCKFIYAHIKVFIVLAILAIGVIHYLSLRHQYHVAKAGKLIAQKALNDHVEADSDAAKKREAENKLNAILAQKKTDANKVAYDAMIAKLELNRDQLQKELTHEKANIMRLYANARQLRDNKTATVGTGLPEVPLSTDLLAETSDYNAIITLVDSSKETTANYNELMQSWLDYCDIYGCEEASR